MTQEIIALLVFSGTVIYVLIRVIKLFRKGSKNNNIGCEACPSAQSCQLKELKENLEKKKQGCEHPEQLEKDERN